MGTEIRIDAQVSSLAAAVDCFTEAELQLLADVEASTVETWRRRGTGPDYVRLGSRILYPRAAVRAFLERNIHVRRQGTAKSQL